MQAVLAPSATARGLGEGFDGRDPFSADVERAFARGLAVDLSPPLDSCRHRQAAASALDAFPSSQDKSLTQSPWRVSLQP